LADVGSIMIDREDAGRDEQAGGRHARQARARRPGKVLRKGRRKIADDSGDLRTEWAAFLGVARRIEPEMRPREFQRFWM
jgi:hypothetical protein